MTQSTHDVTVDGHTVVKRFRSWDHDEPAREWAGLTLLADHAPGLAPEPLERRTEHDAPVVVMTRLAGRPLGSRPLDREQLTALAEALSRLHAVPLDRAASLGERRWAPGELVASLREWISESLPPGSPAVASALHAAREWLDGAEAARLAEPPVERALGHGDGNIGNFLWDGARCRVVDFEDCGASDPAYEVADLLEHVSVWLSGLLDADGLLSRLELDGVHRERVRESRRLMATLWLLMLLPGSPGHARNPPGSLERQADRLHALLSC